jgi:hypothetical protein
MILIDALYINSGGGKVLLDYLIERTFLLNKDVTFLLDSRYFSNKNSLLINYKNIEVLDASIFNRTKYYIKNASNYKTILCFGNIPPPIYLESRVYIYFHQTLYFENIKNLGLISYLHFLFKKKYILFFNKKNYYWIVQSNTIQRDLSKNFKIDNNQILEIPIYPSLFFANRKISQERQNNKIIYVSDGSVHKNHLNLLLGFKNYYDKYKYGELHLTISSTFKKLSKTINQFILDGYPIFNYGEITREELYIHYATSKCLIFPSFSESFGLPIIESIENGCMVAISNLPYAYSICIPDFTFNPYDVNDISSCIKKIFEANYAPQKFTNIDKLDYLLDLINLNNNS